MLIRVFTIEGLHSHCDVELADAIIACQFFIHITSWPLQTVKPPLDVFRCVAKTIVTAYRAGAYGVEVQDMCWDTVIVDAAL